MTAPRPRLLSPYPGAKNPRLYPVHDGNTYDAWLAPFAGSGEQEAWIAARYPGLPIVAADADPSVRAVWECWGDYDLSKMVLGLVDFWIERIASNPKGEFEALRTMFDCQMAEDRPRLESLAAMSIVLRRLTFGGVTRCNKEGALNVALSQPKLDSFLNGDWEFEWPAVPQSLTVYDDYRKVCDAIPGTNAIAIVDPPYWAPGNGPRINGGMTPAYVCHNPQADDTLSLHLDCVERLLASGKVARIVAFNYWGEWAEGEDAPSEYPIKAQMEALAQRYGVTAHFSHIRILNTMHNGNGETRVARFEGVWEIGGRRLYGSRPVVRPQPKPKQLNLLEVA